MTRHDYRHDSRASKALSHGASHFLGSGQRKEAASSARPSRRPCKGAALLQPAVLRCEGGWTIREGRAPRKHWMKRKGRRPFSVVEGNPFGSTEDVGSMSDGNYTCRICFEECEDAGQLISPCQCKGTVTCSMR